MMAAGVLPPPYLMMRRRYEKDGWCVLYGTTEDAVRELWTDCPPPPGLWDHPPIVAIGMENVVVR